MPDTVSLTAWLVDFQKRIAQLQHLAKHHNYHHVWMGGMFNPEADMTATRQASARAHQWSLEKLRLHARVLSDGVAADTSDSTSFIVTGTTIEAAVWDENKRQLEFCNEMTNSMPPIQFTWQNTEDDGTTAAEQSVHQVVLAVYLHETRLECLFSVPLACSDQVPLTAWYQRGVALLATRYG